MNNKKNALIVIQLVGYSLMALYYVYMLRKSYMEYEMTASKYETFKQTVTP